MLFEYFNKFGQRMVYTDDIECVRDDYKKGSLLTRKQDGYKFKLDGKTISYKKIEEMLNEGGDKNATKGSAGKRRKGK